ncbi:TIGR00725 family protein [Methanolobus halotolerans]|uniref:TIGR00725 family protein n=1 Tax=Methanolobus halotolerans TaxID=2052935 RepID=A0A4E0Q2N9_9EURY|nr:TIGR00725 family protein [Methanolobus halotolerans]TGC11479.1 TIGR00725 family protein [Methanolobus halotolerans]
MKMQIGVIGACICDADLYLMAEEVGYEIARNGAFIICGGLGGVMEAAPRGAKKVGGTTIGILPGDNRLSPNHYIDIAILSNMGHARNAIIAQSCDALIAVGGEYGTLSEIALALKMGKTVVTLESRWEIEGTIKADSPREAVELALCAAGTGQDLSFF